MPRYALYFVPKPQSPLGEFGTRWLGWDVCSGAAMSQISIDSLPEGELRQATETPAVYGFHGTLKPPFQLAEDTDLGQVFEHLANFVSTRASFRVPSLMLKDLNGFLALVPSATAPELNRFAAACVREFDRVRAPPSEEELARRRRHGLTARQEEYLLTWGYPYVLEEFRFHLTLTGWLEDGTRQRLAETLLPMLKPLCDDEFWVDAVTLCEQIEAGVPFQAIKRFELTGSTRGGCL